MSTIITDLQQIQQLAQQRQDDFEVLRYMLEFDDDLNDSKLDAYIEALAAPIIAAIDCTQCANCCHSLDVYLTQQDAHRLAQGLNQPVDTVIARYIDRASAASVDEWGKFAERPCPLLCGKRCSVYARRPETCRTYPAFTPDFRWTLADTIQGAGICPIIYNVLVALLDQVDTILRRASD
jgi:Fe-S-cluster containining protein